MIATPQQLRAFLGRVIDDASEQGHVIDGLREELGALSDSNEALVAFGHKLRDLPLRDDWPYEEPDDLPSLQELWDAAGVADKPLDRDEAGARIRTAFLGRVCGCMLGKPFEIGVDMDDIRAALEPHGEWPLVDYPTENALRSLPQLQDQWRELARDRITHVAPDDDINYTILAMLALEQQGVAFTQDDMRRLWLYNLPTLVTFGPERTILVRAAIDALAPGGSERDAWTNTLNPGNELCGALIRADAYGYAAIGRPALAASLAFRDASFTHRRTGVYGAIFVAVAIAVAPRADDPLDAARLALRFVPPNSRFATRVDEALELVAGAGDWLAAYERVHERFGDFGFCRIYQEIGTLLVTLRFATDVGDGICKQVMQGNDTDSFGATAGSILGALHGPNKLEDRWHLPFNDRVHTALALFHEGSLDRVTERMSRLPERIATS